MQETVGLELPLLFLEYSNTSVVVVVVVNIVVEIAVLVVVVEAEMLLLEMANQILVEEVLAKMLTVIPAAMAVQVL